MNEKQTNAVIQPQPVRPTKKQKELLSFIEQFIIEHGYSPSYREIMNGLHYTSVATVALHVGNLIKRGHLIKRDRSARSLEVVNPTGASARLPTNEVKENDEKWLVGKVEKLFLDAEAGALPEPHQVADIVAVLAAMRILGLEAAVQSFSTRLQTLAGTDVKKT
jgi:SOS-response transcriptional repressor LexA